VFIVPRADVLFGDVFEADYLFDVHLEGDAVRLTESAFPAKAPLSGPFYTEPSEKLKLNGDFVRAHGRSGREHPGRESEGTLADPGRAVLLSDDCYIPTAYGSRGDRRSGNGRLLFAIVSKADEGEDVVATVGGNFARFAMPADGPIESNGIAELKNTFLVRAGDVDPAHRIASLDDSGRLALEKRWNAFACRRGPEASQVNASKLGQLLTRGSAPTAEQNDAITLLWQSLELNWDFEGRTMRSVSDALEASEEPEPSLTRVIDDLRRISMLAGEAATRLEAEREN
jgi:hypothetical protein